jgi:tricarballylate dehydrogenase
VIEVQRGFLSSISRKTSMPHLQLSSLAERAWDVVVIGGGNAALVSALSARDQGASVMIIERADTIFRGGNSRHTRNIRCIHGDDSRWNTGAYARDELWKDLCSVGKGPSNEALAELTVDASAEAVAWMTAHGALFQRPLAGTLHLGRTNTFFLGGGKALVNSYYRRAAAQGITVLYDALVTGLEFDGPRCTGVVTRIAEAEHRFRAATVVTASGGFEANIEWLRRYWGDAALNYLIRGTAANDGSVLAMLLDAGAATAGEERGFHSVAIDARSPKFDGGIATRIDSIPFGVVLNSRGERFYDEGEDIWPKRYAIWGGNIALQPGQIAYAFWDSQVQGCFLPPMYGTFSGSSVAEVAAAMGLDGQAAAATIKEYNSCVPVDARDRFDPAVLDGVQAATVPAKSNWALPVDTAPYYGIPLRPGITFTYMGVEVGRDARVRRADGTSFDNVFAAGEIMSGNILSTGYLAGFGMTIGTVWGRIAGREAAQHGRS